MKGIFERISRREFDDPLRFNALVFGGIATVDALVLGPTWFTAGIVGIGLFRMWAMRRPNGYLRAIVQRRYGWED